MTLLSLYPTNAGRVDSTWNNFSALDIQVDDGDTSKALCNASVASGITDAFYECEPLDPGIVAGFTGVNQVIVAKGSVSAQVRTIYLGNIGAWRTPSGSYATFIENLGGVNPNTGNPWKLSEINLPLHSGLEARAGASDGSISVTQAYLTANVILSGGDVAAIVAGLVGAALTLSDLGRLLWQRLRAADVTEEEARRVLEALRVRPRRVFLGA